MLEGMGGSAPQVRQPDQNVIAAIKQALESLGHGPSWGSPSLVKTATATDLSDKKILVVESSAALLAEVIPSLMIATNGKVVFHYVKDSQIKGSAMMLEFDQIVEKFETFEPDIILIDLDLNGKSVLNSEFILESLSGRCPYSLVLALTSRSQNDQESMVTGALGILEKSLFFSRAGIDALAEQVRLHAPFAARQVLEEQGSIVRFNGLVLDADPTGGHRYRGAQTAESLFGRKFHQHTLGAFIERLSSFVEWNDKIEGVAGLIRTPGKASEAFEKYLHEQVAHIESPFHKFCQVVGEVTYLNHVHRIPLAIKGNQKLDFTLHRLGQLETLGACIPWQLAGGEIGAAVANENSYAILLELDRKNPPQVRRIITADKLYEMSDVSGYDYLSLSEDGKPFHRCKTSRLGGRAFFDGERLMAHEMFATCMPDVVFFDGGYMVNSSECTIINGILYPLINRADVTAIPGQELGDGAHRAAYLSNISVANRLVISSDGVAHLGDETIKPIGIFRPSSTSLQGNGFTRYEWSEFVEL